MKKTIIYPGLILIAIIGASSFNIKHSNGMAGQTGSPGENNCGQCHSGGVSASKGVTITSTPAFVLDQYVPGTIYTVMVKVGASGFSRFGFGCEILDSVGANAGTMQSAGAGVKFLNAGQRNNATHTAPKFGTNAATFSFQWLAPQIEKATIYVCGNAVNFNNNTSGDLPIPTSLALMAVPPPIDTTIDSNFTAIKKHLLNPVTGVNVYPNPASRLITISYSLFERGLVTVDLIDISGKTVKQLLKETQMPGGYSQILDLHAVPRDVYFIRTSLADRKVSQKLITVQ